MDASHSEDAPRKSANSLERSNKSHHGLSEKCTNTALELESNLPPFTSRRDTLSGCAYEKHSRGIPHDLIETIIGKHKDHPPQMRSRDFGWLNHVETIRRKVGLNSFLAEDITTLSATPPWQCSYHATINSTVKGCPNKDTPAYSGREAALKTLNLLRPSGIRRMCFS